jgi:hypothetical protein
MALNKFGIKEVADVRFYNIGDVIAVTSSGISLKDGDVKPVLQLDTLKVSTIEFTAEQSEARGGKGNAPLIIWDYGREVNVTLEDALIDMNTLGLLFGDSNGGTIEINANKFPGNYTVIGRTFARNQATGKDHLFTFYIPNAKIQSENTITMEADGDPTVFNMSLRVLRGENGRMMELIADTTEYSGSDIWGNESGDNLYTVELHYPDGKIVETHLTDSYTLPTGYDWKKADDTAVTTITKGTSYTLYGTVKSGS